MTVTKFLSLLAVALAVAVAAPLAAFADDSTASVQADIAKLKSDVQAKHDTVVADAQQVETDASSLTGSSDKKAARETIKTDVTKLVTDWKSMLAVCLADREQLRQDVHAAADGGASKHDLRMLVREANLEIRLVNLDMREAVTKARIAVLKLRQSFAADGHQAPSTPAPPTQTPSAQPVTP